jgi:hypothetical protein
MPKGLRPITTYNVFQTGSGGAYASGARTITKNTSVTSGAIPLGEIAQNGIFSLEYLITGDGTIKIEYLLCSTKDGTYVEPTSAVDIASGLTKNSGTSGHDIISFEPEMAPWMKLKVTETGTSSDAVVTLILNVQ